MCSIIVCFSFLHFEVNYLVLRYKDNYIYMCVRERNPDNLPDFNWFTIRHMINNINETIMFVTAQNNLAQYKKMALSV